MSSFFPFKCLLVLGPWGHPSTAPEGFLRTPGGMIPKTVQKSVRSTSALSNFLDLGGMRSWKTGKGPWSFTKEMNQTWGEKKKTFSGEQNVELCWRDVKQTWSVVSSDWPFIKLFLGWVNTKWPHGIVTMASSSQFTFQLQTGSLLMDLVIWFLCWANSSIPTVDGSEIRRSVTTSGW